MSDQITKNEQQLLIGGKWVDAGDGTYDIINPATEQVVGQAPNASVEGRCRSGRGRGRSPSLLVSHPGRGAPGTAEAGGAGHPGQGRRAGGLGHSRDRCYRFGRFAHAGAGQLRPVRAVHARHPPCTGEVAAALRHRSDAAGPRRTGQRSGLSPTGRRGGGHRLLQLPAHQPGRQDRPGAGHGEHGGGQAGAARPPGHRGADPHPRPGGVSSWRGQPGELAGAGAGLGVGRVA